MNTRAHVHARRARHAAIAIGVFWLAASPAFAQAAKRTADGVPDLSGLWQVLDGAADDLQDHHASPGVRAGVGVVVGNEIPYQPWAAAKKKENFEKRYTLDPESKCYLPGVPRLTFMPFPFQIVQSPAMPASRRPSRFRRPAAAAGARRRAAARRSDQDAMA